ncbi:hypothetical protein [Methylobacterium nonmethylotrophicum]|uniref:Uncharacterized protein n=1 Tax=Methylobacterium nonmethylotrophicum TaxID=1141884 RepID=A0A4Z0NTL8_9HYPH|nr:hypothetical protein [Methylobacterium nonmethylotrophicum]TGE00748.1 hypothetical protein EU555_08380 [Methylobacterium nonmethylotrophicum]
MRILLVGYEPDAVDFSDPALPPGLDAEKVRAGITGTLHDMRQRGWTAEHCLVRPDAAAAGIVAQRLGSASYDCVVIGAGVRQSRAHLAVFEAILNAVHRAAPGARIAFNTRPEDTAAAVDRVSG